MPVRGGPGRARTGDLRGV